MVRNRPLASLFLSIEIKNLKPENSYSDLSFSPISNRRNVIRTYLISSKVKINAVLILF